MKQNETSQPGGPSRIRTAALNKSRLAIMAVTVMIPILLSFQRWHRKHHKHLKLIASETSPTDQTGKPHLPRRWSVTSSTGSDLIEGATTLILWSELRARENRYRGTSRQRELLLSRQ